MARESNQQFRKTNQDLLPLSRDSQPLGQYDLYPAHNLGPGAIAVGFPALAEKLSRLRTVTIDGYSGVLWEAFREQLDAALRALGISPVWQSIDDALRPEDAINALIAPYLGGDDPIFGTRFPGMLAAFFSPAGLSALQPGGGDHLHILYGTGAALGGWAGPLVYLEVPKNEIQFRSRAGVITNLGTGAPAPPKQMYKRFYFVDWPVLNRHKAALLPRIDLLVDAQRPDHPTFVEGPRLRKGLDEIGESAFRVRPWFEPGPWGGQWIREKIPQLPKDVPNYAWSFELIVPENGLILESDHLLLEFSFDLLMFHNHRAVLGDFADTFGYEFPIRFDFLDTVDGGNLSVQVHPRPAFIQKHFGEFFTQDETYYILDAEPGARVYLGFQSGVNPEDFRQALEMSHRENVALDMDRYVNSEPARKHDLFLIPNGTVHCSGEGILVLEISATPYIFTFKMYDWLRLDLEGRPRPLNIDRAFQNLYFDRAGERIKAEFVAQTELSEKGTRWARYHLPTHPAHFYDIQRVEFEDQYAGATGGSPVVMSLVEGQAVQITTANGATRQYSYAETFVVPANAKSYQLKHLGPGTAKVVMAFLKGEWFKNEKNRRLIRPPEINSVK